MKERRGFLAWFAAMLGWGATRINAQASAPRNVKELARHALTGPHAGMEAILVEVTSQPDGASAAHRHPGFVLGYVLEGEMRFAVDGQSPTVIKAGASFFEPIGALHTTSGTAKPDQPVRFLAFVVAPKDSAIVLPA